MHIKRLRILRYRGIENFEWLPRPGMNCLIGPGDSGKSTVLSAVSLLLAPYHISASNEFDYHKRDVAAGFEIEACLGGVDLRAVAPNGPPPLRGWLNGELVALPDENGAEAVILCRVRGTPDLEVLHELPLNGEEAMPFPVSLRKKLYLTRLAGEDRAARDLRLNSGSLLNQHLESPDLRVTLYRTMAEASQAIQLPEAVTTALGRISTRFQERGVPHNLHLGIMPGPGTSLTGMLALLTGESADEAIPLAFAGTGTRQMALIALSAGLAQGAPVVVVDEPEKGLEPYRQRAVTKEISEMVTAAGQAFITTHSPAVLQVLPEGSVWRMRSGQPPLQFTAPETTRLLARDPEAFFARVPIICEGQSECELLRRLLPGLLGTELDVYGIRLIDGGGQPNVFPIVERFLEAGIACAAFLDNEPTHRGRRERLQPRCTFFQWQDAVDIEDAVCRWLPLAQLQAYPGIVAAHRGIDERYLVDQVRSGVNPAPQGRTAAALAAELGEAQFRVAILAAMKQGDWVKKQGGGTVLGNHLAEVGVPPEINRQLAAFSTALQQVLN